MPGEDRGLDSKEIARKIEDLVNNPPPEVTERMRRGLEESRKLRCPGNLDQLLNQRY